MKSTSRYVILFLFLVALFSANAGAVTLQDPVAPIIDQQKAIRVDVEKKRGGWDAISDAKRIDLLKKQDRLMGFLLREGVESISDLNSNEQVEVINTLEWINATAKGAEDERLICKRIRPTGSRLTTRSCKTSAQIAKEREATRDAIRVGSQNSRSAPKQNDF